MAGVPLLGANGSIFDPLYTALGTVLAWLFRGIASYGVAIVLLTVLVRLVLYPLTAKQTRSMQAMQKVQPELKRLQQKYKNDRNKLNEEMMKFYKEHNINPLAGCLPLLLQMPLFIVLYRLILDLTHTVIIGAMVTGMASTAPKLADATIAQSGAGAAKVHGSCPRVKGAHVSRDGRVVCVPNGSLTGDVVVNGEIVGHLAGAQITDGRVHGSAGLDDPVKVVDGNGNNVGTLTGMTVTATLQAKPKHIPASSSMSASLKGHPGEMFSWGIDLAKRAGSVHGFGNAFPFYILVLLTIGTGYYQQRQMTGRTPQDSMNQQAQMMGKVFPLVFGVISLSIPAGVVVYFIVSNVWQIGQQAVMFRNQPLAASAAGGALAAKQPQSQPPAKQAQPQPPAKPKPTPRSSRRNRRRGR